MDDHAEFVARTALDIVRETDAVWTSAWVAERIAAGALWHRAWDNMITTVPEELKQVLMGRLETEDLKHPCLGNIITLLTAWACPLT